MIFKWRPNSFQQSLHNRLQTEKGRLSAAVAACSAAAASVSRPSSPADTAPLPIPPRELHVRARLEDLIDQVLKASTSILGSDVLMSF